MGSGIPKGVQAPTPNYLGYVIAASSAFTTKPARGLAFEGRISKDILLKSDHKPPSPLQTSDTNILPIISPWIVGLGCFKLV